MILGAVLEEGGGVSQEESEEERTDAKAVSCLNV